MVIFRILFLIKKLIRKLWTFKENIKVIYNCNFNTENDFIKIPKIYYGGALKGDVGGPLVKIQKLDKFFPEYNEF